MLLTLRHLCRQTLPAGVRGPTLDVRPAEPTACSMFHYRGNRIGFITLTTHIASGLTFTHTHTNTHLATLTLYHILYTAFQLQQVYSDNSSLSDCHCVSAE